MTTQQKIEVIEWIIERFNTVDDFQPMPSGSPKKFVFDFLNKEIETLKINQTTSA